MFWRIARALLFRLDAERAHHVTMRLFAHACALPGVRGLVRRVFSVTDPRLVVRLWGLEFPNPIGLAAGFDKDARWPDDLAALGFGFVEVGTLTARAQPGNEKPRLFRLPLDRALLNRFGFNNAGAADAAARLTRKPASVLLGMNVGKSKVVPNEEAVADYLASFETVWPHAKYVVVNVSSPNTPGLRQLQDRDALRGLLSALEEKNRSLSNQQKTARKPLLVKVAPDLPDAQADDVVDLALELGLDGIVATNTTLSRDGLITRKEDVEKLGAGGLSGAPLTERSLAFVKRLVARSQGKLPVIGVGGVMNGDDAWRMLEAGASLVQVYSGFVYGGPGFVRRVLGTLVKRLESEEVASIETLTAKARAS